MKAYLCDSNFPFFHLIHKPMFFIYSAGPPACIIVFQSFRFSDPFKRGFQNRFNKFADTLLNPLFPDFFQYIKSACALGR
jgi:hypothetical protein